MQENDKMDTGKPPFFKTWRGMYLLVMGVLVLQIIVYYAITRYFL
ncbi:hypothetical protein [Adhaeribacter terrigena]|nr:hypothetical protein [Adhaeribacter terrigena]